MFFLLADTLSRLVTSNNPKSIPYLDVTIAQVMKIEPTRLQSLQEETKADPVLAKLRELIVTGWPDSMQDLTMELHPYWCFRDELTILNGLITKGNRIVIPNSMQEETLRRIHDGHQGLCSSLQRARRTVYWPNIHKDITTRIQQCDACQVHANKKPKPPERQVSASHPMEIIGMDILEWNKQHALVTIDYYPWYVFYDPVAAETTDAIIGALNTNFRKFGLPQKIISDNGPCFKSKKFDQFCEELEIEHSTSSPYYHQSNGRSERAVGTVKQILKKSSSNLQITLALLAYLDTPVSDSLPSPAELFFNRRINTPLSMMCEATPLRLEEKVKLAQKRSAHLKIPAADNSSYVPNQPVWYTEDGSPDWKPGYLESKDHNPNSFWIVGEGSKRLLRRNRHDIKARYPRTSAPTNNEQPKPPMTCKESSEFSVPASMNVAAPSPDEVTPSGDAALSEPQAASVPRGCEPTAPRACGVAPLKQKSASPCGLGVATRSGRKVKTTRDPDYVY